MTSPLLWTLIALQLAMGGFDMLYHHELTERLGWRPSQQRELRLHGVRNLFYAVIFLALGWLEPHGIWAWLAIVVLAGEVLVTLMDFLEEDATRKLPGSERVTHALLALNYGAILALLLPVLYGWTHLPMGAALVSRGLGSAFLTFAACGVAIFGLRDLAASSRLRRCRPAGAAGLMEALGGRRTVLVTGATGFIGSRLVEALSVAGHDVIVLVRDPAKAAFHPPFMLITSLDQIAADARIDAIVNLAGEPIANGLWTKAKRARIVGSRVDMTNDVVRLIARLKQRPPVLVNGSAIGWYGLQGDEALREFDYGSDCFSREVCVAWEDAANKARVLGVRVVLLRIGLVMGTEGGLLSRLLLPFEFGLGGRIGSGRQWMSWIARDDLVRLIAHVIASPSLSGAVNGTAPDPVRNADFARALGRALHRPAILPLPAMPLRLALGDFAEELFLGGQRVLPQKALMSGFVFRHPDLDGALTAAIHGEREATPAQPAKAA